MNERHAYKIPQLNKWGVIDSNVLEIELTTDSEGKISGDFYNIILSNPHANYLHKDISYTLEKVDKTNKKATFFATSSDLWSGTETKSASNFVSFTFDLPTAYSPGDYDFKIEDKYLFDEEWSEYDGEPGVTSTGNKLTITLNNIGLRILLYRVTVTAKYFSVIGKILTIDFSGESPNISTVDSVLQGGGGGGSSITIDATLSDTSTNPVQNRIITTALNNKAEKDHTHDLETINPKAIIIGKYNSPNYYQNELSADIEAGLTKPIFEVAIGSSEEDKQNAFTTYADGQTYWRKPNFFRNYTELWETRFRYLTYFMDNVQMDANLRVSGTLEVNNGVQLQGSVAAYDLIDARGGLNTTNIAANSVYATISMQTPYLDAATTYVNYIYRKTDQVEGAIGTIQYPFGLVAAKNVYIANTPTDEHHAATKNYVDSNIPIATSQLTNDSGFITVDDIGANNIRMTAGDDQGYFISEYLSLLNTTINGKQDKLTFDTTPTGSSTNPVTSGGIYAALSNKQAKLTFDTAPTVNSVNPVTSGGIYTALSGKQNQITTSTNLSLNSLTAMGLTLGVGGTVTAITSSFTDSVAAATLPTAAGVVSYVTGKNYATQTYVNEAIADLGDVLEYKGTVTNYSNLPTSPSKGDVYNVTNAYGDYPAGTNFAWNGTTWDALGGAIDLSSYQLAEDLIAITTGEIDAILAS